MKLTSPSSIKLLYLLAASFIFLLSLSKSTYAYNYYDNSRYFIGFGAFSSDKEDQSGGELFYQSIGDEYGYQFSATLYNNSHNNDTRDDTGVFTGYSGMVSFAPNQLSLADNILRPYMGIGLFGGELVDKNNSCDRSNNRDNFGSCEDDFFATALYPEVGIRFEIESVMISVYGRHYFDSALDFGSFTAYGASVSWALGR
ncbi:MAG: hypothetical protein ACI93R_001790 [Flavobacteriales bacterium]|jgi:hypothetical protein